MALNQFQRMVVFAVSTKPRTGSVSTVLIRTKITFGRQQTAQTFAFSKWVD
jgi:hypothetical protein